MSILVIWASPNEDGLTSAAKNQVLKGIEQADVKTQVVNLNKCSIERCRICENGWGTCRSKGECIIADDFADIYEKIVNADGVVFVTPVYWHDLAESLKCFMDRLRRCESAHNGFLKGKRCLLVACAGGTGNGAIKCLDKLEDTLRHMEMIAIDRLPVIQFNRSYMLPALVGAGMAFAKHIIGNSETHNRQ